MTAIQIAAWLYANLLPFSVCGIALTVAGCYYDRISTPWSRRIFAGLVLAIVCSAVLSAATTNVVILDMCKTVTPSDWEFWLWGCWLP